MESIHLAAFGPYDDLEELDQEAQHYRHEIIWSLAAILCDDAVLPVDADGSRPPHVCDLCYENSFLICVNALLLELIESLVVEAHSCGKANIPLELTGKRALQSLARATREKARAEAIRRGTNPEYSQPENLTQVPVSQ